MVSLRFPFLFSPPKKNQRPTTKPTTITASTSRHFSTVTIAASAAAAAAIAIIHHHQQETRGQSQRFLQNALNLIYTNLGPNNTTPIWGSLSLTDNQTPAVESKAGVSFPSNLGNSQRLLGIGLRRKSIFGLKNIDVYAYGVYAEENEIKKTLKNVSIPELLEADVCMTVRLQIIYGKLSIRSVRGAFEESIGNRLEKFGGPDNKELLERFTSQFKDEYKLPKGSLINLSKEPGYVLRTSIDGKEVGSVQSKLLCRAILDLYIGEDPFDKQAKHDIEQKLAYLVKE